MGQAQINVRTRACSGTFIARTKQAALTHNVRGKRLNKSIIVFVTLGVRSLANASRAMQFNPLNPLGWGGYRFLKQIWQPWSVVRGRARSCAVVRGRARSCAVVRAWSVMRGSAW